MEIRDYSTIEIVLPKWNLSNIKMPVDSQMANKQMSNFSILVTEKFKEG